MTFSRISTHQGSESLAGRLTDIMKPMNMVVCWRVRPVRAISWLNRSLSVQRIMTDSIVHGLNHHTGL